MDFDHYVIGAEGGRESLVVGAIDGERVLFGTFEAAATPGGVYRWVGHVGGIKGVGTIADCEAMQLQLKGQRRTLVGYRQHLQYRVRHILSEH